jgi:hypothetical protein
MMKDPKMVALGDIGLKGLKGLVLEFNNLPAVETD